MVGKQIGRFLERGELARPDTLGRQPLVDIGRHDPPVAHDDEAGALADGVAAPAATSAGTPVRLTSESGAGGS